MRGIIQGVSFDGPIIFHLVPFSRLMFVGVEVLVQEPIDILRMRNVGPGPAAGGGVCTL